MGGDVPIDLLPSFLSDDRTNSDYRPAIIERSFNVSMNRKLVRGVKTDRQIAEAEVSARYLKGDVSVQEILFRFYFNRGRCLIEHRDV